TLKPINNFIFHPLFDTEWIKRIENAIEITEKYNISREQIAHQIKSTSHIRVQLFFLLLDLKSAKIPKQKRLKIFQFLGDILEIKAKKDIPGYKSNIVHTYEELDIIMKKEFTQANIDIARTLGELYNAAYHLTNGLYTDFYTDYGAENNGPYNLGNNRILVMKQFFDLRPLLLWPENKTPCKSIIIYCIYENVKFSCDAISVHSFYEGDPIKGLVKYRIEIDGKTVSLEELKKIKESIESLSAEQWKRLIGLDNEAIKVKGLFQRCYVFKDLFDYLGIDWKPSKEMMQAVKDKELAWDFWNPPEGNEIEYWRKIADPKV
ncbi:MAG: hypothetical protein Q8O89_05690, partial [Nanoarchaeota archaeon]|nr:hypothetical protein [Nanoarchaeota archaeon]